MSFVTVPITVDPDTLIDTAVDDLQTNIPGFELQQGQLETFLIETLARMTSEAAQVAADVPSAIFAQFGATFFGITQLAGTRATVTTTWTALTDSGWTIPAGTTVAYRLSGDEAVLWQTTTPIPITAGSTTATGVVLTAVEVGTAGNGVLSGTELELIDALAYITDVETTSASAGGVDAESDDEFLARLAQEMTLLTPRPIIASDFAVLAMRQSGVERALGVSGYNPDTVSFNVPRHVAVALVDEDGEPVSGGVKTAVVAALSALREVNFIVHAFNATYTTVAVYFEIYVAEGFTASDVITDVGDRLTAFLSPAVWAGGDQSPPEWRSGYEIVRRFAIGALISAAPGVKFVQTVQLNGLANDVTLAGVAPLPRPGVMSGIAL